jgi:hypothetical protein
MLDKTIHDRVIDIIVESLKLISIYAIIFIY